MRIGVWFQPREPVKRVVERVSSAEELGFDFVGITDGQMIWRDVYTTLALAAAATSRIRMGPWVTNPVTRHVTATANAVCTLDELSGGRAFVGIGVGDDSVHTIGKKPMRLSEFAEYVSVLRRLMAGQEVDTGVEQPWRLSTGRSEPPPVYWAAAGPKSLELAGATADGVIHSGWLVPDLIREDLAAVDRGVAQSGHSTSDFSKIFNTAIAIHPDREVALSWAAPYAARAYLYPASIRVPGWNEDQRQALAEEYDYYGHFSTDQTAGVPSELIPNKVIAGTPSEAVELLQKVVDGGYTSVALIPMGDVDQVVELLAEEVMPRLHVRDSAVHPEMKQRL